MGVTTPPRTPDTPDDENGRADTPPATSEGFAAPPPPDWGDSPQSAAAHLLPEPPPATPEADAQAGAGSRAGAEPESKAVGKAETGEVRAEVESQPGGQPGSEKTVTDLDISGAMQTQVFPQGQRTGAETGQPPVPAPTPPVPAPTPPAPAP